MTGKVIIGGWRHVTHVRRRRMEDEAVVNGCSGVRVSSPASRQVWEQLLVEDSAATTYQTAVWLDCICRVEAYQDASRLFELPHGRQLVLPMVRRSWLPRALAVEASLPGFWGTGGLVAAGSVCATDVAAVWPYLIAGSPGLVRLKPSYLTAAAWNAVQPPAGVIISSVQTHVLDLEGGFERVWKERFKSETRSGARKAERTHLDVEFDTTGRLIPAFYDLYLNWIARRAQERNLPAWVMQRRASSQESLRKFQVVSEALGDRCRTWIARLDGELVAALIMLIHGTHAIYWRGYSARELAARTRANVLLQRLAIEDACAAGCRWYNMGQSGGVASLEQFKARFGARPRQSPQYIFGRSPVIRVQRWQGEFRRRAQRLLERLK
jgi:Acetyltransferase (GNAT) domain